MALLSSRGISTPSLPAQGEQRRSSIFNIPRDISLFGGVQIVEALPTRRVANDLMMVPRALLAAVCNRPFWHVLGRGDAPLMSALSNLR
jgi:hypothetical protein